MTQAIDRFFPCRSVKRHIADKHWITPEIKNLIRNRQKAFHNNNTPLWQSFKNKVQVKITEKKTTLYKNKVDYLKSSDTRKWWKMVNKMTGKPHKTRSCSIERDGVTLNGENLVSALNEFYVSVNSDIPPLDQTSLQAFLPARNHIPTIPLYEVCLKLRALKIHKTAGPEFGYILAEPIAIIFQILEKQSC